MPADEPDMTVASLLAQRDQATATAVTDAERIAAFHKTLRDAGLSVTVCNGLTFRYADCILGMEDEE